MSSRRPPSQPPDLPGYEFRQLLGSGGFADVFLYQQLLPSRQVAVKVLLPGAVDRDLIEHFRQEANVMAQLSTHPSIVTIYSAAVSADGRPYLVMEYCPRPNLGARFRKERFSVPEVLSLGVQITGAVETAHRAGVLHRDIKPANILVTAYNRPALTDFGIATTVGEQEGGSGMSIPWSAPEAFAEPAWSGRESDVFSLGATLYTLLASRSPFELPGMGNTSLDLMTRIQQGEVAPLARSDVPASLEHVLLSSMDPDPRRRYASAMAFGRALQNVEAEMALSVTPLDVLDDSLPANVGDETDDGATRIRGVVSIDPFQSVSSAPTRQQADADDGSTVLRAPGARSAGAQPPGAAPASEASPRPRRRSPRSLLIAIGSAAVLVAVLAVGVGLALNASDDDSPRADPDATLPPVNPQPPPAPINLQGVIEGESVVFTWVNPQPEDDDSYDVRSTPVGADPIHDTVDDPTFTLARDADGTTCVQVSVIRATGLTSPAREGCVDG